MTNTQQNHRDFYRLKFVHPLCGEAKVIPLEDFEVENRYSKVAILDISAGGMRFISAYPLPYCDYQFLLEIKFVLFHEEITSIGEIVRQIESKNYEYCIHFTMGDTERSRMVQMINTLSVKLRKTNTLSSCSFCTVEEIQQLIRD